MNIRLHTDQCLIQYGLFMGTMMKSMLKDENTRRATRVHLFCALLSANRSVGTYILTHADLVNQADAEGVWGSNTSQTRPDGLKRT